ncbi:M20/M25/M40 family metallo-hydrolase [Alteromonas sp. D210916BOD_24]|uniref:M20/M25/M40 family metallo-hydrolase n=1 Tax=Alteromonas sp. D210916BOD_24 TaxID=3157618 RepID=UPI00399CE61D
MKHYKNLLAVALATVSINATAATNNTVPFQDKALELLRTSVAMRTAPGFGKVPEMANWLANEFKAGGFDEQDIHIIPVEDTVALVVRYRGDPISGKKPILLSAHMDVVDALPEDWERDPFTLIEENGYFYGRGTSDDKFPISVMSATLLRLKAEGYVPNRDIILALTGDEETLMLTTQALVEKHRHLIDAEFAIVADGGGGQLDEAGNPVSFMIDSAEKTYASFEVKAVNPGGHSSLPRSDNAIKDLMSALQNIFNYEFPVAHSSITRSYFEQIAPMIGGELGTAMKQFAEDPNDKKALAVLRSYPEYVGSTGTTCIPTMLRAGHADNALPQSAVATVNCRIFPGEGIAKTLATLKKVAANDKLEWRIYDGQKESDASPIREDVFGAVSKSIHSVYPLLPIIPHMASGASDAMHFRSAGIPSYTFTGIFMKASDEYAHGLNERVPVAALPFAMNMWYSILTDLTQ